MLPFDAIQHQHQPVAFASPLSLKANGFGHKLRWIEIIAKRSSCRQRVPAHHEPDPYF